MRTKSFKLDFMFTYINKNNTKKRIRFGYYTQYRLYSFRTLHIMTNNNN